jgi:hypothetical protein
MRLAYIRLKEVSVQEMLADTKNSEYNPSTWRESVLRYSEYKKCQFYKQLDSTTDVFYVSYVADGIHFFAKWSAFSSTLSNNSFVAVYLFEDNAPVYGSCKVVYTSGMPKDGVIRPLANDRENRDWIRKQKNLMVSNCIA